MLQTRRGERSQFCDGFTAVVWKRWLAIFTNNAMIESYEKDVVAKDGAILHSCYRLVRHGTACHIYDMRYETRSDNPGHYPEGQQVNLSEQRYEEIRNGNGFPLRIGRVWIGPTGEWNCEASPHYKNRSMPINKCLEILGYKAG